MVAVIAGIGAMAVIAATLVQGTASRIDTAAAEADAARVSAAADAGVQIALQGLLAEGAGKKWAIDGRVERRSFDGLTLEITVQDERGKVPLGSIDRENIVWLLEGVGLQGERLEVAADSLQDWIDQDDDALPRGGEMDYYLPRGTVPRNDALRSVEELADVRGFTPDLVARLKDVVTTDAGSGAFEARFATPLAIRAMVDGRDDSPQILERKREINGQRVAIALDDPDIWKNRPVTILATARMANGASATRRMVVELTGLQRLRYIVRWTN
jgi:type II secretory pathway component PulK